jgi:hypothetical protein
VERKLNSQTPSPHNPLPPDSYLHDNATKLHAVILLVGNTTVATIDVHTQIKLLDRSDHKLVHLLPDGKLPAQDQALQALLIPTLIALVASLFIALIITLIDMLNLIARITRAHVVQSISLIISNILMFIGMKTVNLRSIRSTIKNSHYIALITTQASRDKVCCFWLALLLTLPTVALASMQYSTQHNISLRTSYHLLPLLLALVTSLIIALTVTLIELLLSLRARITRCLLAPLYLLACGTLTMISMAVLLIKYTAGKMKSHKYTLLISTALLCHREDEYIWLSSLIISLILTTIKHLTLPLLIITMVWMAAWITVISAAKMRRYRNTTILLCTLTVLALCSPAATPQRANLAPPRILPLPLIHFLQAHHTTEPTPGSCVELSHGTQGGNLTGWAQNLRPHIMTALKLSPLLLLHPHQLVVPALSLLPTTKTTLGLMLLSQVPHVLATPLATTDTISAAGTLSTLVATAWAKYLARNETLEKDIGPESIYTVTGGLSTDDNKFCIQTLNIQGGITEAEKMIAIQDVIKKHKPDAMAISEAGKNCKANTLK